MASQRSLLALISASTLFNAFAVASTVKRQFALNRDEGVTRQPELGYHCEAQCSQQWKRVQAKTHEVCTPAVST